MGLYCDLIRLSKGETRKCLELREEEAVYALVQQDRGADWFDIDKAWHGVHFLFYKFNPFEGSASGFLLTGGKPLNDRNWKDIYGVDVPNMRLFRTDEVKEIAAALAVITAKEFRKRYDPDAMTKNEIDPRVWERRRKFPIWGIGKIFADFIASELSVISFRQTQ
jgi:hypothetical protein